MAAMAFPLQPSPVDDGIDGIYNHVLTISDFVSPHTTELSEIGDPSTTNVTIYDPKKNSVEYTVTADANDDKIVKAKGVVLRTDKDQWNLLNDNGDPILTAQVTKSKKGKVVKGQVFKFKGTNSKVLYYDIEKENDEYHAHEPSQNNKKDGRNYTVKGSCSERTWTVSLDGSNNTTVAQMKKSDGAKDRYVVTIKPFTDCRFITLLFVILNSKY